jgi:hypothetical protein
MEEKVNIYAALEDEIADLGNLFKKRFNITEVRISSSDTNQSTLSFFKKEQKVVLTVVLPEDTYNKLKDGRLKASKFYYSYFTEFVWRPYDDLDL